ncbi:arylsulfatase [Polaribacter sp. Asnod6-C07]|uniref:sulfatase family protein n=1 Tax=Polaribacter sp. Asnod6-C07 TaxID=3160582 RepID=UPI00386C818E
MKKRVLVLIINSVFLFFLGLVKIQAQENPNVVFIFVDDLGYGDVGCYGATKVQTPNIDKLATDGRMFTDAHTASAVCTPSRYALMTGEYPIKVDSWGPLPTLSKLIIDPATLTLGKVFQNKGYKTACLGKWHLGFGDDKNDWQVPLGQGPNEVGFDYYWGVPFVNSGSPYVYVENKTIVGYNEDDPLVYLGRNYKGDLKPSPTPTFPKEASKKSDNLFAGGLKAHQIYDDEKTGTYLTEKATEWISKNKENPFFLYFATTNIHHPFTPAPRFKGTSQAGLYGDYIHELDWMVGEIVKSLEENGLTENTMIVFTSDNGAMLNLGGRIAVEKGHKVNGDLLGFKFGVWEGGHRVPFIVKWPGKVPENTTSDQLISTIDMLATFTALTKQEKTIDLTDKNSINVLPAFMGQEGEFRKELLLAPRKEKNLSLRKGKWMYIPAKGSGGFNGSKPHHHAWGGPAGVNLVGGKNSDMENGKLKPDAQPAQLYNLEIDKNQTTNVYNQYPEIVKEMEAILDTYRPKAK